jgi:hypothetical protein
MLIYMPIVVKIKFICTAVYFCHLKLNCEDDIC